MSSIAILIPSYKPSTYIDSCFNSINEQSLSKDKYKVYIALNGPEDNFKEVVFKALKRVSFEYDFFYLEEAGVSKARNYLIEHSSEPFITFIDDDDCISPNYLESLLSVSSEHVMGISNIYNFEKDIDERKANYIGESFLKLNEVEISKFKSRKYFSSPCAKLIHRSAIATTRFNTKLAIGEDALFMAQLSNNIKFVKKTSNTAIYFVFERAGSASRKKVNRASEFKRICYLLFKYTQLFFNPKYNSLFILTRIAATLKFLRRLF